MRSLAILLVLLGGVAAAQNFPTVGDTWPQVEDAYPTTGEVVPSTDNGDRFPWKEPEAPILLAQAPTPRPISSAAPPPVAPTPVTSSPAPPTHYYPLPAARDPAVVASDLLAYQRELEAARSVIPPHRQEFYLAVGAFAAHLAELLDQAVEYDPPSEELLRAVDVGHDVIGFFLDFVVRYEVSAPGVGVDLKQNVDGILAEALWPAMRGVLSDPRWATDRYDDVHNYLNRADAAKELTGKSLAAASYLHPGAQAASIASGAYGAASLVGNLPSALGSIPGLSRVARWLQGAGGTGGTVNLLTTGPGGAQFTVSVVGAAVRVTPLVLTEAEVAALVKSGTISITAAQVYMVASGGGEAAVVGGEPGGGFSSTQTGNTAKNARLLKANMKKAGVKFNKGDAAHHITPSTHPVADLARQLLEEVGIDINATENGIALDWFTHNKTGLHSKAGVQAVVERVQKYAGDREAILAVLKNIAEEIKAGTFPPR